MLSKTPGTMLSHPRGAHARIPIRVMLILKAAVLTTACLTAIAPLVLLGAPVSGDQVQEAAMQFLSRRYPTTKPGSASGAAIKARSSRLVPRQIAPLRHRDAIVGHVVQLQPAGFVLFRADDAAPAIKLYSDNGAFSNLPPRFVEILKCELAGELQEIAQLEARRGKVHRHTDWTVLSSASAAAAAASLGAVTPLDANPGVTLLTSAWDQTGPYAYYCPILLTNGDGIVCHTLSGCVPVAMAQVLRYFRKPAHVLQYHTYTDTNGMIQGTHAISDAGMGNYDWDNMPDSLSADSPQIQIKAVSQLIYHCGVALEADYDVVETTALIQNISCALYNYFGFDCTSVLARVGPDDAWYKLIASSIDAGSPILYAMRSALGGHMVVCDGYRNGNEIHLNFGSGGACNGWYNMDNVQAQGTWTDHVAVFGITPTIAAETPVLHSEPLQSACDQNTASWEPVPALGPTAPQAGAASSPAASPASVATAASTETAGLTASPTAFLSPTGTTGAGITPLDSLPNSLPDLVPAEYSGTNRYWLSPTPISPQQLWWTNIHAYAGPFYDTETLYFNWSEENIGPAPAGPHRVALQVDDVFRTWSITLSASSSVSNYSPTYSLPEDIPLGPLAPGAHTFRVWMDYDGSVSESNETNNYTERTIIVLSTAAVEYWAECADNPLFSNAMSSGWITNTQWLFSGLQTGQTYWYRVKARQGSRETVWSTPEHSQQALLPGLGITPAGLDFGSLELGASRDLTCYVTNYCGGLLTGTATVAAPFTLASEASYSLGAGQGQAIIVRYTPSALGTNFGAVIFTGGEGASLPIRGAAVAGLAFTCQPQSRSLLVGSNATLVAAVAGADPVSYQWFQNGIALGGSTRPALGISGAGAADIGHYWLVASNAYGVVTSAVATVSVDSGLYTFTSFAGPAEGGAGALDGPGPSARFNAPSDVAIGPGGKVYVADSGNNIVRVITAGGMVKTLAGMARMGGSADGRGATARFISPVAVATDNAGNTYVADEGGTIRKITTDAIVTTLAGWANCYGSMDGVGSAARFGYSPCGIAVDGAGNIYINDSCVLRKITPARVVTTLPVLAYSKLTSDPAGNVYVYGTNLVKIAPDGTMTTVPGAPSLAAFAVDGAGYLYCVEMGAMKKYLIPPAGQTNWSATTLCTNLLSLVGPVSGLTVDGNGNLYIADSSGNSIWKLDQTGTLVGLYGGGGQTYDYNCHDGYQNDARFLGPVGIALDNSGNLYVTDDSAVRRITPSGQVSTLAGVPGVRDVYPINGSGSSVRFDSPKGIAVDTDGSAYIADAGNNTIRKLAPSGQVTTFAGALILDCDNYFNCKPQGEYVDGTGIDARFWEPSGLALDPFGDIWIADAANETIRYASPDGVVRTLVGVPQHSGYADGRTSSLFCVPTAVSTDALGNLYVLDGGNNAIRKIPRSGQGSQWDWVEVTTLAGGPHRVGCEDGNSQTASFEFPESLAADQTGNVFVADTGNNRIRKVSLSGDVTTIGGVLGTLQDYDRERTGHVDGTGTEARFNDPRGIAVDNAGNLYITDFGNQAIRKGTPAPIDTPAIDNVLAPAGTLRRLSVSNLTTVGWSWRPVRSPFASTATLSAENIPNPTFTPDANDLYTIRLFCTNAAGQIGIRQLSFQAQPLKPQIIVQPQDQPAYLGDTVGLSTAADGMPPLNYQWHFQGADLPGATNSILVLDSLQQADVGDYSVVVSNPNGSVTSAVAMVTGNLRAPQITSPPCDQTVHVGNPASFVVEAKGFCMSYRWWRNGAMVPGGEGPIYWIDSVQGEDSGGQFFCVVSNAAGVVTSQVAQLTVEVPIAYLRSLVDSTRYLPTNTSTIFAVDGVVTTWTNLTTSGNAEFFIEDATGAIAVFVNGGSWIRPTAGWRVQVKGPLGVYNSLLELNLYETNFQHAVLYKDTGLPPCSRALPFSFQSASSLTVPPASLAAVEALEGTLVTLTNVFFPGAGTFTANKSLTVSNSSGQIFTIFISPYTDIPGKSMPAFAYEVTGVLGQYLGNTATPRTAGYQLIPTRYKDVVTSLPAAFPLQLAIHFDGCHLSWPAEAGSTYSVWSAGSLAGPWAQRAFGLFATDSLLSFTDTNPPSTARFFRVSSP